MMASSVTETSLESATAPQRVSWQRAILRPFSPPVETIRNYSFRKLRKDLVAGLTVSVVEVPQSMAYAIIAGVPPQYGIYTSVIQGVIGAMLSSSEHMTTGPTNTQSLLVASAVHRLVSQTNQPELYLQYVFVLTMLKGMIQLLFASAGLGGMTRYVSRSVISGVVSGAGVLIFAGQLPAFLGIHSSDQSSYPGIFGPVLRVIRHFGEANPRAIIVGAGVLVLIVACRRISRFLPGALIGVLFSAMCVRWLGWNAQELPVIGALPKGFPQIRVPWQGWNVAQRLLGGALALAILGMLESVSIAKSIAARTGEKISPNQEFFAQGLKNLSSSFFQCIPGSGSFTRSALDYEAGAETRFAAVANACFVGCIFWLLADVTKFLPQASLAGVLFVVAAGLIDRQYFFRALRTRRSDAAVFVFTFFAMLLLPLEYVIIGGVVLSLGLYVRTASRLHMHEMVIERKQPRTVEGELSRTDAFNKALLLQVEGDLFFGVADELEAKLELLKPRKVGAYIFRLRRVHSIDSTALAVLEAFVRHVQRQGRHVMFCGLSADVDRTLSAFGITALVGKENTFAVGQEVFASVNQAMRRAETLLGFSLERETLNVPGEERVWTYQI